MKVQEGAIVEGLLANGESTLWHKEFVVLSPSL